MGDVFFYHLTESPLERALPPLLGKALEAGWRVELRGREAAAMDRLDQALWLGAEESFLPHGRAGGAHDARQPVLLTAGEGAANAPACLMSVGGAEVSAEEVAALSRACVLFDGSDEAAVQHARGQWKALTRAGTKAQYWAQEGGRWQKKAES
ncbi:DNA polymerase III subunit chi [Pseudoroseicyclus tamaricis]|uniref:DNA polymerase III subunit chi n=1 Tax=Pseudoroseicyclus tamaricis TaxID=2705421 RepID=A0A6B2JJJ9_9RHOB|nr:DNA polymerase III subunit chi [Pseudoroseicyclus tamaricis]NDV01621.1 DNA polymerase III subunit chi [Pseudoroseicyclus tamaricis]